MIFFLFLTHVSRAPYLNLMNLTCCPCNREYSRLISKRLKGKSLRVKHNFITPQYTRDNHMRCLMKTQVFDWNICWFDWTWNATNDLWILLFPRDRCALSVLAFYAYAKDHVSSLFCLLIQNKHITCCRLCICNLTVISPRKLAIIRLDPQHELLDL